MLVGAEFLTDLRSHNSSMTGHRSYEKTGGANSYEVGRKQYDSLVSDMRSKCLCVSCERKKTGNI